MTCNIWIQEPEFMIPVLLLIYCETKHITSILVLQLLEVTLNVFKDAFSIFLHFYIIQNFKDKRLCQCSLSWFKDVDLTPLVTHCLGLILCAEFTAVACGRYCCARRADTAGDTWS